MCLEPHGPTACRLERNLAGCSDWSGRWSVDRRAAWRPGTGTIPLWLRDDAAPGNSTLYTSLLGAGPGSDEGRVPAVALDELIRSARPDLLKIDTEGAEWPALSGSRLLGSVSRVIGEYHACAWDGRVWGPAELTELLETHGFRVRVVERDANHGLFWADRGE